VREGNRVVIREGDRSIIREGGGRAIIRHNEASRFAINARNVQVERHGANTETIIERPNGVRIVNIADADGRLIRRVRRDRDGREIIIIDNSYGGPRASTMFIELPPPVIRIPRDHYIVEADRARPQDIYAVFMAPPVEVLPELYTLDQVRFSEPLRERMPRVPGARREFGDARLRRAIPEGAELRPLASQPTRRDPAHHAADRSGGAERRAAALGCAQLLHFIEKKSRRSTSSCCFAREPRNDDPAKDDARK
jgi:hypothetical protein